MQVVAAGRESDHGIAVRLQAHWLLHALLHPVRRRLGRHALGPVV